MGWSVVGENGSYNWTYYAEEKNSENILVIKQERTVIEAFVREFDKLKNMFEKVSKISDQLVPMLYDTHISLEKPYVALMSSRTREILDWSSGKEVLLGIPAWDEPTASHHPNIENLENALHGIHAALEPKIPKNYAGIALYAHFTMNDSRWKTLKQEFTHHP